MQIDNGVLQIIVIGLLCFGSWSMYANYKAVRCIQDLCMLRNYDKLLATLSTSVSMGLLKDEKISRILDKYDETKIREYREAVTAINVCTMETVMRESSIYSRLIKYRILHGKTYAMPTAAQIVSGDRIEFKEEENEKK